MIVELIFAGIVVAIFVFAASYAALYLAAKVLDLGKKVYDYFKWRGDR